MDCGLKKRKFSTLPDDITRGAGVLPLAQSTGRFLLSLRGPTKEGPYTWCGWGGHSVVGETPEKTATREFFEETLYQGNIFLIPLFEQKNTIDTFSFTPFIGVISEEFDPILDMENVDFKWVSLSQLLGEGIKYYERFSDVIRENEETIRYIRNKLGILNE